MCILTENEWEKIEKAMTENERKPASQTEVDRITKTSKYFSVADIGAAETYAAYVLDRGIASAKAEIDRLNIELQSAAKKKGVWDEYHSLAIRNIFELKRVIQAFQMMRNCIPGMTVDYLSGSSGGDIHGI
jgi:hypothetical protein